MLHFSISHVGSSVPRLVYFESPATDSDVVLHKCFVIRLSSASCSTTSCCSINVLRTLAFKAMLYLNKNNFESLMPLIVTCCYFLVVEFWSPVFCVFLTLSVVRNAGIHHYCRTNRKRRIVEWNTVGRILIAAGKFLKEEAANDRTQQKVL